MLLEHVAHGAQEPPVLAIEMLNPASELRPWVQLAIVLGSPAAAQATARTEAEALASGSALT